MSRDIASKKIRRLALADINLRETYSLASLLQGLDRDDHYLISALRAGLVVAYARSFVRCDGIGPLEEAFAHFPDKDLQSTHDAVMTLRHKIYAHRDMTSAKEFRLSPDVAQAPYEVSIEFHESLSGFDLVVSTPQFGSDLLPRILILCEFQSERIRMALKAAVEPFLDPERVMPRRQYVLGRDFP